MFPKCKCELTDCIDCTGLCDDESCKTCYPIFKGSDPYATLPCVGGMLSGEYVLCATDFKGPYMNAGYTYWPVMFSFIVPGTEMKKFIVLVEKNYLDYLCDISPTGADGNIDILAGLFPEIEKIYGGLSGQ